MGEQQHDTGPFRLLTPNSLVDMQRRMSEAGRASRRESNVNKHTELTGENREEEETKVVPSIGQQLNLHSGRIRAAGKHVCMVHAPIRSLSI